VTGKLHRYLVFAGLDYYPAPAWQNFVGSRQFITDAQSLAHGALTRDGARELGLWTDMDWFQIVDGHTGTILTGAGARDGAE